MAVTIIIDRENGDDYKIYQVVGDWKYTHSNYQKLPCADRDFDYDVYEEGKLVSDVKLNAGEIDRLLDKLYEEAA